jgi:GT2 family glycosyltransferase
MRTSIIVPVYNRWEETNVCLRSLVKTKSEDDEIIVIDNGSKEYLIDVVVDIYNYNEENLGFPKAVNQGVSLARGKYICIMNNDIVVTGNWLNNLIDHIENGHADIIGPITNESSGKQARLVKIYQNYEELENIAKELSEVNKARFTEVGWLIGFLFVCPKMIFEKLGGFDERYNIGNWEDIDFCYSAKQAGLHIAIAEDVYVHHFGSSSFKEDLITYKKLLRDNQKLFEEKWKGVKYEQ